MLCGAYSQPVIRDVLQHYGQLHPDQVIIAKLDETTSVLDLFAFLCESGLALSYFSNGPSITSNLIVASPATIANSIAQR